MNGPNGALQIEGCQVRRGTFELRADLTVEAGSVTAVLGPNGAGKTTLLRAVAGLERLEGGQVSLGGRVLDGPGATTPAERRSVGYVPQSLGLFEHLDVLGNVAFGPRMGGASRSEAQRLARTCLDQMGVGDLSALRPEELSGGQAQRVALARALATRPAILLLDEPLSAIDPGARSQLRAALAEAFRAHDGPSLVVTHDIVDAGVLADRVVVLEEGRVVQAGSVDELVSRPNTPWVASAAGVNMWVGFASDRSVTVDTTDPDGFTVHLAEPAHGRVMVTASARAVALHRRMPTGSARNRWELTVASVEPAAGRVRVTLDGSARVISEVTPGAVDDLELRTGDRVWASLKATDTQVSPG